MISKHRFVAITICLFLTITTSAWGGELTSNQFFYKPSLGPRGEVEKGLFDAGLDRVDTRLGREIWVGDPNYGTTLQAALTAVGGSSVILRVPAGTYSISADVVSPANVTLKPERGAVFSIATGKTLTINGGLEAGLYQIFSCTGTGKADLTSAKIRYVYPEWWYLGPGDWSPAIKAAVDSRPTAAGNTVILAGSYTCNTQILCNRNGVSILGPGGYLGAQINFAPTAAQTLFKFQADSGMLVSGSLKNICLVGSAAYTKTYVNLVDTDIFEIENVQVYDTSSQNNIGLLTNGRDHLRVTKFTATCDRPIVIGTNPNSTISLDGSVFREIYLICNRADGKNVEVLTGANLSNVYFEPPFHCNSGGYGFYWNDTTSTTTSINVGIRGLRAEQPRADGWTVWIHNAAGVLGLVLDGVFGGLQNGYYLRHIGGEIRSCQHLGILAGSGGGEQYTVGRALDLDDINGDVLFTNFTNVNARSNAAGAVNGIYIGPNAIKSFALPMNSSSYAYSTRNLELYTRSNDLDIRATLWHRGVKRWVWTGVVANNGTQNLAIRAGTGVFNAGIISVVAAKTDGSTREWGDVVASYGGAALKAGSTNFALAAGAGKVALSAGTNPMTINNQLGYDATITLVAEWTDGLSN